MPLTLLIVEDHLPLRTILRQWLAVAFDPCRVLEAGTGLEAIDIVQQQHPHLVLMDLDLPQMDGLTATRRLKALAPNTPVVMLSIHQDPAHRADAAAAGAAAYISKSELESKLIPTLETLLAGGEAEAIYPCRPGPMKRCR